MHIPMKRRSIQYTGQRHYKPYALQNRKMAGYRITPATDWSVDENVTRQSNGQLFEWPRLYHTHHNRSNEDLSFWLKLAKQQNGPILELGCGTGRVAIPLARAGYEVYGLDRDSLMLEYLQSSQITSTNLPLNVFQADLTEFHLEKEFSLILLPCNTLSTLSSHDRQAMLVCVKRHLSMGGLFAASLPNPIRLAKLPLHSEIELEDEFVHPTSGEPIQVSSSWDHDHRYFTLYWHYDHLFPDGLVERLTVTTRHDLSPFEVYLDEMKKVNLLLDAAYGDFDSSRYHRNSPNLILLMKNC